MAGNEVISMSWKMPIRFTAIGRKVHFTVKNQYEVTYDPETGFWSCDCHAGTYAAGKNASTTCKHSIVCRNLFKEFARGLR